MQSCLWIKATRTILTQSFHTDYLSYILSSCGMRYLLGRVINLRNKQVIFRNNYVTDDLIVKKLPEKGDVIFMPTRDASELILNRHESLIRRSCPKPIKNASDLLELPYTYVLQRSTVKKKECEKETFSRINESLGKQVTINNVCL